jgi:hypothetical protein
MMRWQRFVNTLRQIRQWRFVGQSWTDRAHPLSYDASRMEGFT